MLSSPSHVVLGSSDPEVGARFLALFGFETVADGVLDATAARRLYGQEVDSRELVVASPGSSSGWIRLVETPGRYTPPKPNEPRSLAVVIETRDLERSLEQASTAGLTCGKPLTDALRNVREALVEGPDDLKLLLRQVGGAAGGSRSLLRNRPDRLHSEVASVLWSAHTFNSIDAYWGNDDGGLVVEDSYVVPESAVIVQAAGMKKRIRPFPCKRVTDSWKRPLALELIELEEPDAGTRPTWPLALGIHAIAFHVSSLRLVNSSWKSHAAYSETVTVDSGVHVESRGITLRGPGRVRFEVWHEETPVPPTVH